MLFFQLVFCSVQFSHSVMSDSLRPHESQHARPPSPSPSPGVHSNSCPLSWWCHLAISSSVVPFSFCPQSLPASGSFPMSQLFAWGGQSIGVSAFSISPSNEHAGLISFRMDWLDLLAVQGTVKSLLQHHSSKLVLKHHKHYYSQKLCIILSGVARDLKFAMYTLLFLPIFTSFSPKLVGKTFR